MFLAYVNIDDFPVGFQLDGDGNVTVIAGCRARVSAGIADGLGGLGGRRIRG